MAKNEEKLVKSKRKVSCFGCHFKIKNFTMSTCLLLLLLLLLCPQSTMIKTIFSWNRFHGIKCLEKKKFLPAHILIPSSSCHLLSIVAPSPFIAAMSDLRIYASLKQKITFFRFCKKTRKYFPLQNFLTSNIYALSLNPHKKKLRENYLEKNEI
jgi:hypothetical protein